MERCQISQPHNVLFPKEFAFYPGLAPGTGCGDGDLSPRKPGDALAKPGALMGRMAPAAGGCLLPDTASLQEIGSFGSNHRGLIRDRALAKRRKTWTGPWRHWEAGSKSTKAERRDRYLFGTFSMTHNTPLRGNTSVRTHNKQLARGKTSSRDCGEPEE